MQKKYLLLPLIGLLAGCAEMFQDWELNRRQLDQEAGYICSVELNAEVGTDVYSQCRIFYDQLLLQYDTNPSRPLNYQVSEFANRSRPLAERCRNYYGANTAQVWTCLKTQENQMVEEYVRKKLLREEEERERRLIAAQESERHYWREKERRHNRPAPPPAHGGPAGGAPQVQQQQSAQSSVVIINNNNNNNNVVKNNGGKNRKNDKNKNKRPNKNNKNNKKEREQNDAHPQKH